MAQIIFVRWLDQWLAMWIQQISTNFLSLCFWHCVGTLWIVEGFSLTSVNQNWCLACPLTTFYFCNWVPQTGIMHRRVLQDSQFWSLESEEHGAGVCVCDTRWGPWCHIIARWGNHVCHSSYTAPNDIMGPHPCDMDSSVLFTSQRSHLWKPPPTDFGDEVSITWNWAHTQALP